MKDPEEFDAFYKDARARLLLQAYALTGDLPAARSSVRDGFVLAWHHWRKVARTGSAEAWVRPHVWQHAHRRHTARVWHREKGLDPELQATLEALGQLSTTQRRVLLLAHLASTTVARPAPRPRCCCVGSRASPARSGGPGRASCGARARPGVVRTRSWARSRRSPPSGSPARC